MEKINFSVENIEEISENPDSSFSIMKVDFFASGDNSHELIISEETLLKTAKTIYNVPVVWKYDKTSDDAMSHETDEYPCGFVKEGSLIEEKRLSDNRLMLSTVVYIWKKYSGKLIDIFKRDRKKSVSVEMTVLEANDDSGKVEVTDYKFEAITILGRFIRPAIPDASISVLSFSNEYKKVYEKEFGFNKYSGIDMTIPPQIKESATKAIEKHKMSGKGGNSVSLALAKTLANEEKITPEKIRLMYRKLSSYVKKTIESEEDSVRFDLWGGVSGYEWCKDLFSKIEEIDNKVGAFFDAEEQGKEEETVKKDKKEFEAEDVPVEVEKPEESFEAEAPKDEPKEESEKPETEKEFEQEEETSTEGEGEEEGEDTSAEMSLDSYLDMAYMLALMEAETEARKEFLKEEDVFALNCAIDEMKKEGDKDFSIVSKGMFAKMKEMSCKMEKMEAENKAYMEEFEALRTFKKTSDEARFAFEVESTLKEVESVMPSEELDMAKKESFNFNLSNVDIWKNAVKAKAFTFATPQDKKINKDKSVPRWAYELGNTNTKESLWKKNN